MGKTGHWGEKNFWNKSRHIRFASHTVYHLREHAAKTHITTGLLYCLPRFEKIRFKQLTVSFLDRHIGWSLFD